MPAQAACNTRLSACQDVSRPACTERKSLFVKLTGVHDEDGQLTQYGERLEYLWGTDPARSEQP